jgi:RNase adapter protein RapZ
MSERARSMTILVVTGLSGAGKSTALRALEDVGFFCVDNLPVPLIGRFVELLSHTGEVDRIALVADAREGDFLAGSREVLGALRAQGHGVEVLFLTASEEHLMRRFSETRRRHPLGGDDLRRGIALEREMLAGLREDANAVVDTGNLNVHQLKGIIQERYGRQEGFALTLLSFGYKHGLPAEADMVLDVRFLPNPYFVAALSAKAGTDPEVAAYVLEVAEAREFLDRTQALLEFLLPHVEREGKGYFTIAVGCTGGRHRSVAIAAELARRLSGHQVTLRHRDLGRGPA